MDMIHTFASLEHLVEGELKEIATKAEAGMSLTGTSLEHLEELADTLLSLKKLCWIYKYEKSHPMWYSDQPHWDSGHHPRHHDTEHHEAHHDNPRMRR
jgi:hypothetical protein